MFAAKLSIYATKCVRNTNKYKIAVLGNVSLLTDRALVRWNGRQFACCIHEGNGANDRIIR